jgi:hypothetical protein
MKKVEPMRVRVGCYEIRFNLDNFGRAYVRAGWLIFPLNLSRVTKSSLRACGLVAAEKFQHLSAEVEPTCMRIGFFVTLKCYRSDKLSDSLKCVKSEAWSVSQRVYTLRRVETVSQIMSYWEILTTS